MRTRNDSSSEAWSADFRPQPAPFTRTKVRAASGATFPAILLSSLLCLPCIPWAAQPLTFPSIPATPPEAAEKTFETLHGFRMELIAAEPLVTDPVAVTYDEDGRAYVCEMSDYPYTDKARHKPSQENPTDQSIGKVRLLTDTDDDGVFDKATIFAADLSWPTGAACWKGGIIVVATPDIWYLKDTDNDGVADVRQKLFTGLKKLNIQAVANNPIWGLDNKIYIAGGSNGGVIQNLVHPEEPPLTLRRADLRLDPVTMKLELTSGGARFGNTRDDWGNRFLCNIRNPAQHVVIDLKYLARNPYLPPVNPLHDAAEAGDQLPVHRISPPEAWRELRAQRWSAEGSKLPRSELVGTGVVTSSSGITCYRGDAYPAKFRGNLFVADVAANLFYRLVPEPDGVTFKANRSPEDGDKEFCASRDIWHRPVNFANAPDGTLTVCDMYREAIEHPWSLPDDIHAAIDLERGRDKGRLYRLAPPGPSIVVPPSGGISGSKAPPEGGTTRRPTPRLSKATTEELVKLLEHANAWHRDTAHRLLFERQDKSSVPLLRSMALQSRESTNPSTKTNPTPVAPHDSALTRVEALWVLESFDRLNDQVLSKALIDDNERVQQHAIHLAEKYLPANGNESWRIAVASLADSKFMPVRFRVALSMQTEFGVHSHVALEKILQRDMNDHWMLAAIGSTSDGWGMNSLLLDQLDQQQTTPHLEPFASMTAETVASEGSEQLCSVFVSILANHSSEHPAFCKNILAAFTSRYTTRTGKSLGGLPLQPGVVARLRTIATEQREKAATVTLPLEERIRAIALLSLEDFPTLRPLTAKLLQPSEPDAIRLATIQLLRQKPDKEVAALLLDAWPTLTPAPREAAAQALASRAPWTEALFTAIEKLQIKPAEISPTIRAILQRLTNPALRERVAKLFTASGTRAEVLTKYQSSLSLKGDPDSGHAIYTAACAVCHRKGTEGRDLGPNLATVLTWSQDQLLTNILDPNREVSPNFLLYAVELNDGRILSGLITSETATSIALKSADGMEQNVARIEVKSLKSTGMSLMPEGLEAAITPQQMADLMAFLREAGGKAP